MVLKVVEETFGKSAGKKKSSRRNVLLGAVASLVIVAVVVLVVVGVGRVDSGSVSPTTSQKNWGAAIAAIADHPIVKFSCSATLYPDLCFATVVASSSTSKITKTKDVIEAVLNHTITTVQHNYFTLHHIITAQTRSGSAGLSPREKTALHDCLEMVDDTLDELHKSALDLHHYPLLNNKSISQHADDLITLLSAAMTNQDTCIDGFSHDGADKKIRKGLMDGQMHAFRLCSNVLAMIKNLTDTDLAAAAAAASASTSSKTGRRLLLRLREEKDKDDEEAAAATEMIKWPQWLSAGDRRLLQESTVTADVTVAADGSGNYKTVGEAVAVAPERSSKRYIIRIKAGVYRENVEVPKKKTNIMFVGDGRTNTIITASRNVVDGSTTFHSATVAVVGDGFLARDITFENTAGASKHQAVALRVGSDLSAFYECDMLAYQDTLYIHSLRQFFVRCLVAGTVDFIFGNAAALFQDCDIHARRPNSGQRNMVTAQGRDDPNQNTGIVIHKCRIDATSDLKAVQSSFPTYLGRPWKEYSRTVIMQTSISDVINPSGWYHWDGNFALDTLFYGEYQNTGAGADTSNRVSNWKGFKVITSATEAQAFTAGTFIGGGSWLPSTGFPFSLGL